MAKKINMSLYISTSGACKDTIVVSTLRSMENNSSGLALTEPKISIIFDSQCGLYAAATKYIADNFVADQLYPLVEPEELRPGTLTLEQVGARLHLYCMVASVGWIWSSNIKYDLGYFEILDCNLPEDPAAGTLRKYLDDANARNDELRMIVHMRRLDLVAANNKVSDLVGLVESLEGAKSAIERVLEGQLDINNALREEINDLKAEIGRSAWPRPGYSTNNKSIGAHTMNTICSPPVGPPENTDDSNYGNDSNDIGRAGCTYTTGENNKYIGYVANPSCMRIGPMSRKIENKPVLSVGDLAAEIKLFNKASLRDSKIGK